SGGGGGAGMGGAIFLANGNLSLNVVTLTDNQARGGKGGTYNNPSTAFGGAGGAGPLGAGGASTTDDGVDGIFGAGGSGGGLRFSGESRANGGNGGYGAGAGSVGSSGGGASGLGTTGIPGTFGGTTSNPANGVVQSGGGGAGLGAGLFIYGGSVTLNTVNVLNNSTQAGGSGGSGASSGQAKASGIFHFNGSINNNGVFVSGNSASNAGSADSDNADFYSQTGLTLVESNPPVIGKSIPIDGESNYQKTDGLIIYMNENIFNTDGSAIVDADLSGIVTFKETDAAGADVPFSASIIRNKITITPDSELTNGETYYISIANLEDRYGNEMAGTETITFTVDGTPPVFTADPESGTTILGRSFAFTADEPFFDLDGTEIEPFEYINVIKVRLDDASGELVSTTITRDGNTLQVSLDESLPDQLYHVTLENIADANGNEITPQVFTYSRPTFAQAKIRVNPRDGSTLSTQAIQVTFEEDYYVETAPGTFALFNTRSYAPSYMDAVLDLKLNDENGTDIIDRWSFNTDGNVLYILSKTEPNSTYYLKIANLYTADETPVEAVEVTFTTPDTFNPVQGSGYAASFNRVSTDQNESLGTAYTVEFAVKIKNGGLNQVFFTGQSPNGTSEKVIFWLNGDKLTLSKVDGSANIIGSQTIESSAITGFDNYQDVAFTYDNSNIILYHNGAAVGSGSMDLDNYKLTEFSIPGSSTITGDFGTVFLNGRQLLFTDEIRVWSTALAAQTILDGINTPITTSHPQFADLKNLWTFDENGGKLGFDAKTGIANLCFSCSGTIPVWEQSNRRDEATIQVSENDIILNSGDEIEFTAGNGGQLQKQFTITNTGTVDLNLLGEASVSDFEGRFTIDYSATDLIIEPGASTSFTVTFQSSDVRVYNTFLTIPNSSLDNVFEVALVGRGVSLSNGNWEKVKSEQLIPAIKELYVDNGELFVATTNEIRKASISSDGSLQFDETINLATSFNSSHYDLVKDQAGNFYSLNDPGNGTGIQLKNLVTNASESFLIDQSNDLMDGILKVDRTGTVRFMHSYRDGSATNQYGIKVQNGIPSTETITLTMEDLQTVFGTGIGSTVFAYNMAFSSTNQLFATVATNGSNVLVLKYDPINGWDDIGYDYNTIPVSRPAQYVNLLIDDNDDIHVGGIEGQQLRYHHFSATGTLLDGGFTTDRLTGSDYTSFPSRQGNNLFGLGAANEPMFLFLGTSASSGVSAAVYEDGTFRLFNDTYVSGVAPQSISLAQLAIDEVTGRPFVSTDGSNGPSDLWTTEAITPKVGVTINGIEVERGATLPIQIGVGYDKEFELDITNLGLTNLQLNGDPVIEITGDQSADLSFDASEVSTIVLINGKVSIPMTFSPKTTYTNSEVVITIPSNSPGESFEFTLSLSALDDTNSGEWILYTDTNLGALNSRDMTLYNGEPIWVTNRIRNKGVFQNPNRGSQSEQLYTVQLELFDVSGTNPISVRDYFSNDVNASPTLLWDDFYLNQFQNLKVEVDPALGLPTLITNGVNGVTSYVPNDDGGYEFLTREGYNEFGDLVFDDSNEFYYLKLESSNLVIRRGIDNSYVVSFSGLSNPNTDMDLEAYGDDLYFTYGDNTSLEVRRIASDAATNSGMTTLLSASDVRFSEASQSKTKDLEFSNDGLLYLAYIVNSTGNVAVKTYDGVGSWTDLPTLDLSSTLSSASDIQDMQLEIHPDGSPYISVVYDDTPTQGFSLVYRLENNTWVQQSSANFFPYGGLNVSDSPTGHIAVSEPLVKTSVLEINDGGVIYWLSGFEINRMIPTPEAFDKAPSFTTSPSISTVEESALFSYDIVVNDADAGDEIIITAIDVPSWLTFTDNGDRTASLAGTPSDDDVASYTITLSASDGRIEVTQEVMLEVTNINDDPD
ncbi:MAG: Ig-like domain-containing protein, partial [Ekhidna sp.]